METKKRKLSLIIICTCLLTVFGTAFVNIAVAKPVTLKVMCMYPPPERPDRIVDIFINQVNQKAKGKLVLKFAGGPEAMPLHQQLDALKGGIIDILFAPGTFFEGTIPEARALGLTKQTLFGTMDTKRERETGFYEFMRDRLEEAGVHYLGRADVTLPWYFLLNKKITKLEDISQIMLASGPSIYVDYAKSLGGKAASINIPDMYSALDRGTVDGVIYPLPLFMAFSLQEVTKYIVLPPIMNANTNIIVVNLKNWNKLPKSMQKVLQESAIQAEHTAELMNLGLEQKLKKIAEISGLEPIQLSPADTKKMQSRYIDVSWDIIKKKLSPEQYQELRELAELKK